jgi:hypothetical protein
MRAPCPAHLLLLLTTVLVFFHFLFFSSQYSSKPDVLSVLSLSLSGSEPTRVLGRGEVRRKYGIYEGSREK